MNAPDAGSAGTIPDVEDAIGRIREITFGDRPASSFRIGVEAELIPIVRDTRRVASIRSAIVPALEPLAGAAGWVRNTTAKGAPVYDMPAGGRLTFEPGGQIEYATPPLDSPSIALEHLRAVLTPLTDQLADRGIDLYGIGIDPFNGPGDVTLQVDADRYRLMDEYYAGFGPAGARMMRQTASIQLNIDSTCDRTLLWRVLNALAPVLVAMFANSRRYADREAAWANFRSHTWQLLDRTRTGLPWAGTSPERCYADFALDAPAMFRRTADGRHVPLREWIRNGYATPAFIAEHLSSLFPEVRPRRYFEVRSIDALPLSMYAAPVLLVSGLALDEAALHTAAGILGEPDTIWLRRAARSGMRDATLASRAMEIARLAMGVCRRRPDLCRPSDLEAAESFFGRFTEQRRSPGDAADALTAAATAA